MGGMDNRSLILHCALALFSARGYDAVGIQEIVEAASVTKPTLYHYFTNKRGLLDCLLETHFSEMFVGLYQAADYHGDLTLTLENIARSYFSYAKENPAFYRMQLSLYFAPPTANRTWRWPVSTWNSTRWSRKFLAWQSKNTAICAGDTANMQQLSWA